MKLINNPFSDQFQITENPFSDQFQITKTRPTTPCQGVGGSGGRAPPGKTSNKFEGVWGAEPSRQNLETIRGVWGADAPPRIKLSCVFSQPRASSQGRQMPSETLLL